MRVTTVADAEAAALGAADRVETLLGEAIGERGVAHVALAGGSTPRRCHELLAEREVEWGRVHVWLSDERCVGPDDEESNFRMVRESLLDRVAIPAENVHRPLGERGPDAASRAYEDELCAAVETGGEGIPVIDVLMAGIGEDGHTLSLFPGHREVDEAERLVVGVRDAPKPPPERISFTLPLVRAARRTLLLAAGSSKADAVAAVLAGADRRVPASLLRFGRLELIADDAAVPAGRGAG